MEFHDHIWNHHKKYIQISTNMPGIGLYNLSKNVKLIEFHYYIWIHHGKCIQISTNMSGIGSLIHEIAVQISDM